MDEDAYYKDAIVRQRARINKNWALYQNIHDLRNVHKLRCKEIAERYGVHKCTVSHILTGQRRAAQLIRDYFQYRKELEESGRQHDSSRH